MRSNADLNLEVKPQILATLYTPNDETPSRSLTDTDFVSNSPEWQFGTSERDIFSVGGAVISSFDFTLMNDEGQFDGINWYDARVAVTLRCLLNNSSNTTDIDMGYYYVTKHHEQGNFITVECYDALKVLDEYQIHELRINGQPISDAQWETGFDIATFMGMLADKAGLAISGLSASASSITIHNPNNDQMTIRAAVSYLAQMVGQYVRIDVSGGTMVFGWYDLSSTHHAGTTFNHDLRTSDITITGATVSDYKDETVIKSETSNPIAIKDNPFIDANNAQDVYNAVNSAVTGLTFRPGSATIVASPAYEPGDVLLINTGQESNIKVIATNLTYKPQVTESISCDADPESGDLRINNLEYIKKQAQKAAENQIGDDLTDPDSDLSKAIAGAGGTFGILVPATGVYSYYLDSYWSHLKAYKMSGNGFEIITPSNCSIARQMVTLPTYAAIKEAASLVGADPWRIDFPVTMQVMADNWEGTITFTCRWVQPGSSDEESTIVQFTRFYPALMHSTSSSRAEFVVMPFPPPYNRGEGRSKRLARVGGTNEWQWY